MVDFGSLSGFKLSIWVLESYHELSRDRDSEEGVRGAAGRRHTHVPEKPDFEERERRPRTPVMDDSTDLDFQNVSHQRSRPPC